jgi:altronate dehydratase
LRWAIARENIGVRQFVAEQAVLLASGRLQPSAPASQDEPIDALSQEQRDEIEKLIAEVEDEIKVMNEKKAASQDVKNIKASWEEKQEAARTEKKG